MKLTRGNRILLELFGPPASGALLYSIFITVFVVWDAVTKNILGWETLVGLGGVYFLALIFAYVFVGLQCILYTVIMEWRFKCGLNPDSWSMVVLSTVLGFLSGVALIIVMEDFSNFKTKIYLIWGGLGVMVGLLMGLLIKWGSTTEKPTVEESV